MGVTGPTALQHPPPDSPDERTSSPQDQLTPALPHLRPALTPAGNKNETGRREGACAGEWGGSLSGRSMSPDPARPPANTHAALLRGHRGRARGQNGQSPLSRSSYSYRRQTEPTGTNWSAPRTDRIGAKINRPSWAASFDGHLRETPGRLCHSQSPLLPFNTTPGWVVQL